MAIHKRKYTLQARAERQRQTRERIVAATVALHEEVGPARTTIAEIARRAGVQRLTVYNTFPDPVDLFAACQGRFLTESPPPDLEPRAGAAPLARLEEVLTGLYGWYRSTEAMERNVHRDRKLVPDLDRLMAQTGDARFAAVADVHAAAIAGASAPPALVTLIRLALEFHTWELLTREGMTDGDAAALMTRAVSSWGQSSSNMPPSSAASASEPKK